MVAICVRRGAVGVEECEGVAGVGIRGRGALYCIGLEIPLFQSARLAGAAVRSSRLLAPLCDDG